MRQRGFLDPALLIILVIIAAVAGGAYYFGKVSNKTNTSTVSTPTITSTPTVKDEFIIKEFSIKFPTATVKDFDYVIKGNVVHFSTKSLANAEGEYCTADHSPIGIVTILTSPMVQETNGPEVGPPLAQVGTMYIYYTHPQVTCSDDKDIQGLQSKAIRELQQQLKLAQATN